MIAPRRLQRPIRFAILLGVVLSAAWFVRSYSFERIPATDQSLEPVYPAGSRVVYREIDADDPLPRDADVVYAMERDGTTYARFGRVRGLPGDRIGARDGRLTVNDRLLGPIALPGEALGEVPPGHVCILATSPFTHEFYADSRKLGFLPRAQVLGIIRFRFGD